MRIRYALRRGAVFVATAVLVGCAGALFSILVSAMTPYHLYG